MEQIMSTPVKLQLLYEQQLYQQLAFRERSDERMSECRLSIPKCGQTLSPEVKIELVNQELWQQFHAETTEMIITKTGRRMFPSLQLKISGLQNYSYYYVVVEMTPSSTRRHKFCGNGGLDDVSGNKDGNPGGWTTAGPAEPQSHLDRRIYLHPDGPAMGVHWMQHIVSFSKLKITNNAPDHRNNIVLTSMHRYIPKIWIFQCEKARALDELYSYPSVSFVFKETQFIAVTAYQNENITKLKINNNPFAKGFRETGQSRCKRKFQTPTAYHRLNQMDDEENLSSPELDVNRDICRLDSQRLKITPSTDDSGHFDIRGATAPQSPNTVSTRSSSPEAIDEGERHRPSRLHRPWLDPSPVRKCNSPPFLSPSPLLSSPWMTYHTVKSSSYHRFSYAPLFRHYQFAREYRSCHICAQNHRDKTFPHLSLQSSCDKSFYR